MNDSDSSDMSLRLSVLRRLRRNGKPGGWARIAKIAAEYRRMVRVDEDNTDVVPSEVGQLVCFAYPERIAMAIDKIGTYRLSNGKEVRIDAKDDITAHEWIVVASMYDGAGTAGRGHHACCAGRPRPCCRWACAACPGVGVGACGILI